MTDAEIQAAFDAKYAPKTDEGFTSEELALAGFIFDVLNEQDEDAYISAADRLGDVTIDGRGFDLRLLAQGILKGLS